MRTIEHIRRSAAVTAVVLVAAACSGAAEEVTTTTTTRQAETTSTTTTTTSPTSSADGYEAVTLAEGLPRTGTYSFLDFTVTEAVLADIEPRSYLRDEWVAGENRHLFVTLDVLNTSESDTANWPPTPLRLEVDGVGQPVGQVLEGRPHIGLPPLRSDEIVIAWEVPDGVGFDDLVVTVAEEDRIPMMLPLTGDVPESRYPVAVDLSAQGPAQGVGVGCRQALDVSVLGGEVSLDLLDTDRAPTGYGSRRAAVGDRFLTVDVQVYNNGGSRCGAGSTNIGNSDVRLLVDGVPREPITWVNTIIGLDAALDLTFHFAFPTSANEVVLAFGSEDATRLMVPVDVSATPEIAWEG